MDKSAGKIAILGGGMAGLSAAWRLSEPGWQERFASITVYQRGWRLGGKAASSRGPNGRIEEHGLHIWLGSYENAFAMLRECYAELDRVNTDPSAPIHDWDQALVPSEFVGVTEKWAGEWSIWLGEFARNGGLPGQPDADGRALTTVEFVQRSVQLVLDFADSVIEESRSKLKLSASPEARSSRGHLATVIARAAAAAALAVTQAVSGGVDQDSKAEVLLDHALDAVRIAVDSEEQLDRRRSWALISMLVATIRGIIADGVVTDARGFRALNEENFEDWVVRHGGHKEVLESPLIRGIYDLVFGYEDGHPDRPRFPAGLMVFMSGQVLFTYKGALFWKMTAGMGDVVIAPIYQALRKRGVRFEFFHRLDSLELDTNCQAVETISFGRQLDLQNGVDEYEPLVRVRNLPVFPDRPRKDQIRANGAIGALESHFAPRADVGTRVLRRGVDFDQVILAVSVGMLPIVAQDLIKDRPEWRAMTSNLRTVATQSVQLWFRRDEARLGWKWPGATISAYERPLETWASMSQTLWSEDWPPDDTPRAVMYLCGSFDAQWPTTQNLEEYVRHTESRVHQDAVDFMNKHSSLFLPDAQAGEGRFAWHLLTGVKDETGLEALATQYVSTNIDPSDRYVQSIPGTDRFRLRPDESGYDNLALAGDWTDSGINAGCIEAAVISGLQAANYILGRGRRHRIRGYYLP
jgi:uncharacterized protein with NAD-binding domain and iron-sulfur cluster